MANLYQKTKNMVSKANSKLKMIKGAIRDKNGVIVDDNSFDTIPDEIETIKIISNPNPEVISLISETKYEDRYVYRSVTNIKTGISLLFFKDKDDNPHSEYGFINKIDEGNILIYQMPLKEDGTAYILGDNDAVFAVHDYFFMRVQKDDGSIIDFISEDGKTWDSDVAKILNGYKQLVGAFFGLTDQSVSLLVYNPKTQMNDPYDLYELDFVNKEMKLNEMYEGVFRYNNASIDNLSTRTDNVYFSMPRTVENGNSVTSMLTYSRVSDPFNHLMIELGEELTTLFTEYKSMVCTHKNTIAIAAIDDGNKINIIEIIFTINDNTPNISKRIIETNIVMENDMKMAVYQDVYMIATGSKVRWSYNMDVWHDLYVPENDSISDMTVDNKYVYIHTVNGNTTTYTLSLVTASDVPEGKVFLNHEGELVKGTAGNGYQTALRMGLISSIDVTDKAFLNDTFTFDPREQAHAFNHIIYYGDEYLFAVGFLNRLIILRSRDGFSWTKGFETEEMNINFVSGRFNRWHFEEYEGILYFMQSNITYSEAGVFRVDIYPDHIDLVQNSEVFWNRTEVAENFNLFFINPVCNGLLYGFYNESPNVFEKLLIVDDYGINTIYEETMEVEHVVDISNLDNGAVIFTKNGFYVLIDEKIYKNDTSIAYDNFASMKVLSYKDIIIILQQTFNATIPFISFYKLKEEDMKAYKVEDNMLPDEYRLFRRKPYLPIGDVCNNLLIVDDYNCKETAFIVDLEDNFKIVKYEDDTDMNRNKFIQFCNGKIFLVNQYKKSKTIHTGNIGIDHDWIDLAASDKYYLTISSDDQMVYCSSNGLEWKVLEAYANDGKIADRIVAGGRNIAVAYLGESQYLWVSTDEGASWYQMWFPWTFWVQNVEMLHTANGYELFVYAKLNADDPYNIIYSSHDFDLWNETSIITTTSNVNTNEEWRDITCNEDGLWVAIDSDSTRVIYSSDGVTWEEALMPRKLEWSSVIHTPKGFFATARHSIYAAYSEDGKEWIEIRMPEEPGIMEKNYDWTSAAYGKIDDKDTLVVLSYNGLFASGPDFFNLELKQNIPNREWRRVVFQDKKFVALAANTSRSAYSLDGLTWSDAILPTTANWVHLLYASGAFVAIDAECKNMATSITGISWLTEPVEDGKIYRFIDYRNDKFVVFQIEGVVDKSEFVYEYVGTSDTLKEWISGAGYQNGMVFTSVDGVIVNKNDDEIGWNIKALPCGTSDTQWLEYSFEESLKWTNICESKGKKVILGINSDKGVWSSDGIVWETITLPFEGEWTNVEFALNKFIVFAKNDSRYLTSYDGKSWNVGELPVAAEWVGCLYAKTKLYLYSNTSTTYYVSNNLIAWKEYNRDGRIWSSLTYDGNNFFGVVDGYASAYKSPDGITWETISLGVANNYNRIVFINDILFITSRDSGVITYSEDGGSSWLRTEVEDVNSDWKIEKIGDRLYLLGNDTDIAYTSLTGIGWDKISLKYSSNWIGGWKLDETDTSMATYNLFAQDLGQIEYSYDGIFFYKLSRVDEILHGNGMFVVVDKAIGVNSESVMYYSYDLVSWEISKPRLSGKIVDIDYGDGKYMLITNRSSNFTFESSDIVNWSLVSVPTTKTAEKIIYGQKGFLILEDSSSGVLLFDNSFGLKSYDLPVAMNPLAVSSGAITIINDLNTGKFYISYNNRETWFEELNGVNAQDIGTIRAVSLTDCLIFYSDTTVYLYSILRDMWQFISTPFTKILGFEEITQMMEYGNEKRVLIYDQNHISYIENASTMTGDIVLGEIINLDVNIRQVIKNIDQDGFYLLHDDGTINGERLNVEYDGFDDNEIDVVKIVRNDSLYLAMTDTNFYYISNDFESWYRYSWPLDLIPSYLNVSQGHFIAILSNQYCDYLAVSVNGKIFDYIDFKDTYDTEAIVMCSNYNIFISKYGKTLDEVMIREYYFLLNTVGKNKTKYDRVSPIKPAFAKGSFNVTEPYQDIKIDLNFTPTKVFVRSVLRNTDKEISQIMLSEDSVFHQEMSESMTENCKKLSIEMNDDITIGDGTGSRIVAFGFHVSPGTVGEYIYYAFN